MSAKTDKLAKGIQDVKQFVVAHASSMAFNGISKALQQLETSLSTGMLMVQIVSHERSQAERLQSLLAKTILIEKYQVRADILPDLPALDAPLPPPTLILRSSGLTGQPLCYAVSPAQKQVIGRNPNAAQILLPDSLSLVSGCHAEFWYSEDGKWQIRDRSSKNGTYLNGSEQALEGWQQLKVDDRLCLGSSKNAIGSVTLNVDVSDQAATAIAEARKLLNCNVVCLIVDLSQPFAEGDQRFVAQAVQTSLTKVFVIDATPAVTSPVVARKNLTNLEHWLNSQPYRAQIELVPLLLQPIAPIPGATVWMPHAQPKFEQFYQILETLANDKAEEMLLQRVTTQLLMQIAAIEAVLSNQATELTQQLQQEEEKLLELKPAVLREQLRKTLAKLKEDKDQFFKQAKDDISQSKTALLNGLIKGSLTHKIQQFSKDLQPQVVSDRSGYRQIQLQIDDSEDVHTVATRLCRSELQRWFHSEWHKVCKHHNGDGLQGLYQRSYATLGFIPNFDLASIWLKDASTVDDQPVLSTPVVELACESRFKQPSLFGYLFKNIKGQVISSLATLMLVVQIVPDEVLGSKINPNQNSNSGQATNPAQVVKEIKKSLLIALLPTVAILSYVSYKHDREVKLEEETEKLQKETVSYYQSLTKNLTEQLEMDLREALEGEEKRFRETLEIVNEQGIAHLSELEKNQTQAKAQIESRRKAQQVALEKDQAELQRLRRDVSTSNKVAQVKG
ncbi:MAG: FHA domain-containing protein [Stenomitos rutilans HA7619-LM2]|jgi:hypothetical protein|nr:FHA domain-containing protein [Stenomitos rutilans HA7619-LM2]